VNTTSVSSDTSSESPEVGSIEMKLELVTLPVSDVDRANQDAASRPGVGRLTMAVKARFGSAA